MINNDNIFEREFSLEVMKYYSTRYAKKYTSTLSLNKLEAKFEKRKRTILWYSIAGYLYYCVPDKVNKFRHPNLMKILNDFSKSIQKHNKNNPYWKVDHEIKVLSLEKANTDSAKKAIWEFINQNLDVKKININLLAEISNVKYSALYNFIKNKKLSELSLINARRVEKNLYKLLN